MNSLHQPPLLPTSNGSPSRRELLLAMTGVAGTVVMVAFDATIVSTTLPKVAQALNGMALYAWVGAAYFLATAASILIFGRLGDIYGRKRLMLCSVSLEALGSIACGLSHSMEQLIAFRTLEGIGGGMMIATAFAAPADLFPDARERIRWMSLVSATFAIASGIGPMLGGVVTQALGWRAAFFISPLAAAITLFLLARYFPRLPPPSSESRGIDWIGAILLVIAIAAPLAALELAFTAGSGTHPRLAIGLALGGLAAMVLLVRYERTVDAPIFPLRILASPEPRLLTLIALCIGGAMLNLIFYSPLLLQHELGYTPRQSGLLLTPLVAAIPIGSIINGQLFPRQKAPQRLMVLGSLLLAIGCAMELMISATSSSIWILATFFVIGLSLGFLLPNLSLFMQILNERRDVGVASALIQATRAIGSAVGTTLVGILIGYSSVLQGIRGGLILCIGLALASGFLANRIKIKNLPRSH